MKLWHLSFFMLACCFNGTMIDLGEKNKMPNINVLGSIEDMSSQATDVEYLLIGNRYADIPVYAVTQSNTSAEQKIQTVAIDPTHNKIFIDLKNIKSIELSDKEHPSASLIEIKQRTYVQVIITSINGSQDTYLIESNRKITCKQPDKDPNDPQKSIFKDRELTMSHVKKVLILGFKTPKESDFIAEKKEYSEEEQKALDKKQELTKNTATLIEQIEETIKKLKDSDPLQLEKAKDTLTTLVKLLREQIQKILNLL